MDIHVRGNREEVLSALRGLPAALARGNGKLGSMGDALAGKLAAAFYGLVEADFKVKSLGGPGSDGVSWPKNTEKTLAYSKGAKSDRSGSGESPNNKPGGPAAHGGVLGRDPGSGELSKTELVTWWQFYNKRKRQLLRQHFGDTSIPSVGKRETRRLRRALATASATREIKSRAAAFAWMQVKEMGAKRLLDTVGQRDAMILVDKTTRLRTSIEPTADAESVTAENRYVPNDGQIFDRMGNRISLGTSVEYARIHHFGIGVPMRRLWPRRLPERWKERMAMQVRDAMLTLKDAMARHWTVL